MDSGQGNSPTYRESAVARSWSRCRPWHLFIAKSQSSSVMELRTTEGTQWIWLAGVSLVRVWSEGGGGLGSGERERAKYDPVFVIVFEKKQKKEGDDMG